MNARSPQTLTIGRLSKASGVPIDTIRYYERERLLPAPQRSPSGYRHFDEHALQQLQFIRRAKALGFSLDEVRDLLLLSTDRETGVQGVKQRAQQRLQQVEQRIQELTQIRQALTELVQACPGSGDPDACPILLSMQHEPGRCCAGKDSAERTGGDV